MEPAQETSGAAMEGVMAEPIAPVEAETTCKVPGYNPHIPK